VGLLLVSTHSIYAQESPTFEKIGDISPDGKFALRSSCSGERVGAGHGNFNLLTAAEPVSLPSITPKLQIM
jgi:hypothetical protein